MEAQNTSTADPDLSRCGAHRACASQTSARRLANFWLSARGGWNDNRAAALDIQNGISESMNESDQFDDDDDDDDLFGWGCDAQQNISSVLQLLLS